MDKDFDACRNPMELYKAIEDAIAAPVDVTEEQDELNLTPRGVNYYTEAGTKDLYEEEKKREAANNALLCKDIRDAEVKLWEQYLDLDLPSIPSSNEPTDHMVWCLKFQRVINAGKAKKDGLKGTDAAQGEQKKVPEQEGQEEIPDEFRSAPMALTSFAEIWGGQMTAKSLKAIIDTGRIKVKKWNRQKYEFDIRCLPKKSRDRLKT